VQQPHQLQLFGLAGEQAPPRAVQLKPSQAAHCLKLFAVDRVAVACFRKLLVFLDPDSCELRHAEPLAHVFDACALDHKSIAVSCKLPEGCFVCTYSVAQFVLLSVCATETPVRSLFCLAVG